MRFFFTLLVVTLVFQIGNTQSFRGEDKGVPLASKSKQEKIVMQGFYFGIDSVVDLSIPRLEYADTDAYEISDFLTHNSLYESLPPVILTNENAGRDSIWTVLELFQLSDKIKLVDRVIIYFASHGELINEKFYLLGANAILHRPRMSMISLEQLLSYIKEITETGVQVVLIIDTCHAGQFNYPNPNSEDKTIKFLACGPKESAFEGHKWNDGQGVYTYHLIEGMKGNALKDENEIVTVKDLGRYVEDEVEKSTEKRQIPIYSLQHGRIPISKVEQIEVLSESDYSEDLPILNNSLNLHSNENQSAPKIKKEDSSEILSQPIKTKRNNKSSITDTIPDPKTAPKKVSYLNAIERFRNKITADPFTPPSEQELIQVQDYVNALLKNSQLKQTRVYKRLRQDSLFIRGAQKLLAYKNNLEEFSDWLLNSPKNSLNLKGDFFAALLNSPVSDQFLSFENNDNKILNLVKGASVIGIISKKYKEENADYLLLGKKENEHSGEVAKILVKLNAKFKEIKKTDIKLAENFFNSILYSSISDFEKAIILSPHYVNSWMYLIDAHLAIDDYKNAITLTDSALAHNADYMHLYLMKAWIYYKIGNQNSANESLNIFNKQLKEIKDLPILSREKTRKGILSEQQQFMVDEIMLGDQVFFLLDSNSYCVQCPVPIANFAWFENETGILFDSIQFFNHSLGELDDSIWNFGDTITFLHDTSQFSYYLDLFAENEYGESDTTNQIIVLPAPKKLLMPNVFIPKIDSIKNGKFKPSGSGLLSFRIRIYSIWGQLIWSSNKLINSQPLESWDGSFNGKMMPTGIYLWKIEAKFKDGTLWTKGENEVNKPQYFGAFLLLR